MNDESDDLQRRIARAVSEHISVAAYDPAWPGMFLKERKRLLEIVPAGIITRIEHFGSTAVPGLAAKPVVDVLVGVVSLDAARERAVPVLFGAGYEYFWRPSFGDDVPPWYAWFIRRNADGSRSHHVHMVEGGYPQWDGLLFRDYLVRFPEAAAEYAALKRRLSREHPNDRSAYSAGKSSFIARHTSLAKELFAAGRG